ncbi:hypothetical protein Tco_0342180, partial [Tanacetum coccineum]
MNKTSRLGKGTALENRLLFCVPDTAYGSCLIRRILEKLKFSSCLGKGTASENRLLFCVPDTTYDLCLIRRISEKSALAVEIDLTWSRGFIYVELDRLP